jgi:hypothetical protein
MINQLKNVTLDLYIVNIQGDSVRCAYSITARDQTDFFNDLLGKRIKTLVRDYSA